MLLFLIVSLCVISCSSTRKVRDVKVGGPSPMSVPVSPDNNKPLPTPVPLSIRTIDIAK
jgi:hypothetical protein